MMLDIMVIGIIGSVTKLYIATMYANAKVKSCIPIMNMEFT